MAAKVQTQSNTGRPPTTSVLRSAIYYQNRIIVPEKKIRSPTNSSPKTPDRPNTLLNGPTTGSRTQSSNNRPTSLGGRISDSAVNRTTRLNTDATARSGNSGINSGLSTTDHDTMDSHGIDIVVTDTEEVEKKPSIWKRFYLCLQDNRMKGKPNAEEILASSNPQDFKTLKKVLNISFLTIGIALLIAVVIVIIYSTIDS